MQLPKNYGPIIYSALLTTFVLIYVVMLGSELRKDIAFLELRITKVEEVAKLVDNLGDLGSLMKRAKQVVEHFEERENDVR